MIRKATAGDMDAIEAIYDRIHTDQEQGNTVIGWQRGIYPTRHNAEAALQRQDLFVLTDEAGRVLGRPSLTNGRTISISMLPGSIRHPRRRSW